MAKFTTEYLREQSGDTDVCKLDVSCLIRDCVVKYFCGTKELLREASEAI